MSGPHQGKCGSEAHQRHAAAWPPAWRVRICGPEAWHPWSARAWSEVRSEQGGQDGFAVLAALLIMILATLAASTLVAVLLAGRAVGNADADGERALALAEGGVSSAIEALRWKPSLVPPVGQSMALSASSADGEGSVAIELTGMAQSGSADRFVAATVSARRGRALRRLRVVLRVGNPALPRGVTVTNDADVRAPVTVINAGIYLGGVLRGRQMVTFGDPTDDASSPPDDAYPTLYPRAAVHAGQGIYDASGEEHLVGSAWPNDTDVHNGGSTPAALLNLPDAAALGDLAAHAVALDSALDTETAVLRLDAIAASPAEALPAANTDDGAGVYPEGGLLAVVDALALPVDLTVCGQRQRPPTACPLTLVVDGDASIGPAADSAVSASAEGGGAELSGALIVLGTLTIREPLRVNGSLAAQRLVVEAPLTVVYPADGSSPPGPASVSVAQWSDLSGQ